MVEVLRVTKGLASKLVTSHDKLSTKLIQSIIQKFEAPFAHIMNILCYSTKQKSVL